VWVASGMAAMHDGVPYASFGLRLILMPNMTS
jgi:hypothetical protein